MSQRPTLRIRFTLNRASGARSSELTTFKTKARQYAYTVINEVGIEYAKGEFLELRAKIQGNIKQAVQTEIRHIVRQYQRFIVGKDRIGGTLTTSAKTTTLPNNLQGPLNASAATGNNVGPQATANLRQGLGSWKPLSKKYRRKKWDMFGGPHWFEYSKYLGSQMTAEAWEEFFGPVHVSVQPIASRDASEGTLIGGGTAFRNGTGRFGVAKISVSVFGLVTPAMVAALAGGTEIRDERKSGLLSLVAAHNDELAMHLGGNTKYVPSRPTLQPFLAFAITRSVPAAVFSRLEKQGFSSNK